MKHFTKLIGIIMLAVVIGFFFASCGNGTTGSSGALDGLLREYMGTKPEIGDDGATHHVYFLDPARFEAFKAELEKTGEYSQTSSTPEESRSYDLGLTNATLTFVGAESDGVFFLHHMKRDNSAVWYDYAKVPQASGTKLAGLLRKYTGPHSQNWDDGVAYVSYLDPARFEAFKAALDASGEYSQTGTWTENRNNNQGLLYAMWVIRPDGTPGLQLCKADNSVVAYDYKKLTQ